MRQIWPILQTVVVSEGLVFLVDVFIEDVLFGYLLMVQPAASSLGSAAI